MTVNKRIFKSNVEIQDNLEVVDTVYADKMQVNQFHPDTMDVKELTVTKRDDESGGSADISGDLTVDGDTSLSDTSIEGSLTIDATGQGDSVTVGGDVALTGDFTETGSASISGDVSVGGDLAVTGTATLTGTLTANGGADITGTTDVDTLNSSAKATLYSLEVTTASDLKGATTIGTPQTNANLTVNGNETVSGTLGVTGKTTTGTLESGASTFTGTITATGQTVDAATFTGNAATATKLAATRNINDTAFDGSANITTTKWGAARTIKIQDNDGTNIESTGVSVNGSADATLVLPATIKATLSGNASTASALTTTAAGDSTHPVYFANGVPAQCDATIANNISGTATTATNYNTSTGTIKDHVGTHAAPQVYGHVQFEESIGGNRTDMTVSEKGIRDFVNSSIGTATANFLGTYKALADAQHPDTSLGFTQVQVDGMTDPYSTASEAIATALDVKVWPVVDGYDQFTSVDQYVGHYVDVSGTKTEVTDANKSSLSITPGTTVAYDAPSPNDYVFVEMDFTTPATSPDEYRRYKYNEDTGWGYEYTLNNSSYTEAQWRAIDSGITATKVGYYDTHIGSDASVGKPNIHVPASSDTTGTRLLTNTNSGAPTWGYGVQTAWYNSVGTFATQAEYIGYYVDVSNVKTLVTNDNYTTITTANSTVAYTYTSNTTLASSKLTKDSLDAKLDDSQLVTSWQSTVSDSNIPSEKLVKDTFVDLSSAQTIPGFKTFKSTETGAYINTFGMYANNIDRGSASVDKTCFFRLADRNGYGMGQIGIIQTTGGPWGVHIATGDDFTSIGTNLTLLNDSNTKKLYIPATVNENYSAVRYDFFNNNIGTTTQTALDAKVDKAGDTMTGDLTLGEGVRIMGPYGNTTVPFIATAGANQLNLSYPSKYTVIFGNTRRLVYSTNESGTSTTYQLADTTDLENKVVGPLLVTDEHVAVFDGTTGKLVKDSGYTIGKSVPSNALFTDEKVNQSSDSSNQNRPLLLAYGDTSTGNGVYHSFKNSSIYANPSTGIITATGFAGDLTGTATKATGDEDGTNIKTYYALKSELPTVNNGTLSIKDAQSTPVTAAEFTANQSGNSSLTFEGSGGTTVVADATNHKITISSPSVSYPVTSVNTATGAVVLDGADIVITGYSKPSSASALAATDTVNAALGKLEKGLDGKQASGTYLTSSQVRNVTVSSSAPTSSDGQDGDIWIEY